MPEIGLMSRVLDNGPGNRVWFGLVWLGWVLWHINHCKLFNSKSIYIANSQFYFTQFSSDKVLSFNVKNVLFRAVQFSISAQFNCQCLSITGTSPSDCLVSNSGHSLVESYLSAEGQSVYSIAPINRARETGFNLRLSNTKDSTMELGA